MRQTEIKLKIDNYIDSLFFELQEELGIDNGEIDFAMAFDLDDAEERLATIIDNVLDYQIEQMKADTESEDKEE